ncbi:MAG: hypothetical protein QOG04_2086 [Actinomycetota bacterium]|jgi:hypothetical protein|nr:hypothetical protein [Actinomycetota bacterium]
MSSGLVAIVAALVVWTFVEGFGRIYPSKAAWLRIRSRHGRRAARAMRERFEAGSEHGTPNWLTITLCALVGAWIASASLLDKRWWEVVLDVLPYALVGAAFLRLPKMMHKIAERMKTYERDLGEDPESDYNDGDGGAAVIAL